MTEHLHDFVPIYHTHEAIVEICQKPQCHYKTVCKFGIDGSYNVREYNELHRRDFLQPWMKEFNREYRK